MCVCEREKVRVCVYVRESECVSVFDRQAALAGTQEQRVY